ncbi:hypothetical protein BX666DRAFT_1837298, partial [Dichotomocladium elegans]
EEMEKEAAAEQLKQKFRHDQYELPAMDSSVRPNTNDPRLATEDELVDFINMYHPSEQDIDTEAFKALPPEIQYEIVQDIKLKSRQTSWARLDEMIRKSRTALDFSKQQIKQLMHRNRMTQKMLEMDGFGNKDLMSAPGRVASERGRQYLLVKNEDVSQGLGWKLPGTAPAEPSSQEKDDHTLRKDDLPSRLQPEQMQLFSNSPSEDKVRDAVANNPRLAALFADIDSEPEDAMDEVSDDDEPLFVRPNKELSSVAFHPDDLLDDIRAYAEDDEEALHAVIQQIYTDEANDAINVNVSKDNPEVDKMASLNEKDMYDLWLSKAPDAFVYLHSTNDQYKKLLHESIYNQDIPQIEAALERVQKIYGKTNEHDEMLQESLAFHEEFLHAVLCWKHAQPLPENVNENVAPPLSEHIDHVHRSTVSALKHENVALVNLDPESPESVDYVMDDDIETINEPLVTIGEYERQIKKNIEDEDSGSRTISIKQAQQDKANITTLPSKDNPLFVLEKKNTPSLERPVASDTENQDMAITASLVNRETGPHEHVDVSSIQASEELTMEKPLSNDHSFTQEEVQIPSVIQKQQPTNAVDYGYNSDEEIANTVEDEENEFARFVSDLSQKDIESVREELHQDMKELNKQQRKEKGNTDEITNQMIQDIQELLRLFGIPFIISPMEAEAQCAELLRLTLVEGVVTDDSDVFLFGGTKIYKNMFNNQKYVECYLISDIEREMQLDRNKLIQLAFLLGSDYTDGIPGVGPVAAMEVLAEFTHEDDKAVEAPLKRFREWYESGEDATSFQRKFV